MLNKVLKICKNDNMLLKAGTRNKRTGNQVAVYYTFSYRNFKRTGNQVAVSYTFSYRTFKT